MHALEFIARLEVLAELERIPKLELEIHRLRVQNALLRNHLSASPKQRF